MKTCKTISIFILMLTGYLCNGDDAVTDSDVPTKGLSPLLRSYIEGSTHHSGPEGTSTHHSEPEGTSSNSSPPARQLSSTVVAGISISLVFLFIIIITVFWYARKKSKESSAEVNSVLSTDPGVSLRNISVNENHPEWPFERALH